MTRARPLAYAVCLASALTLTSACGDDQDRPSSSPRTAAASSPAPSVTPTPTPTPSPTPTPTPVDPGTLPQTPDRPDATDPQFQARIATLWQAIATNDPTAAHGTFFPLAAYRQIKAINDPDGDYAHRLLAEYDLDIAAAHQRVGPGASFVRVDVPDAAQWMLPGTEYNKGPYWRVLGTRLVYRSAAGAEESFGITSMISWRGQWYPVHLGPLNRPAGTGAVTP